MTHLMTQTQEFEANKGSNLPLFVKNSQKAEWIPPSLMLALLANLFVRFTVWKQHKANVEVVHFC